MVHDFFPNIMFNLLFSIEIIFYQIMYLYIFYLCYNSKNVFYTLLYIFILFFFIGLFFSFWQLEIFTGFFWLLELTIIFIFLLVLFYLNFKGYNNELTQNNLLVYKFIFIFIYIPINFIIPGVKEFIYFNEITFFLIWENFYESIQNFSMNDFSIFLLSYYNFNSLEFILLGLIIFIGSIVCINLYKINKNNVIKNSIISLNLFNFFINLINFNFLRKQNLNIQSLTIPSTKIINKF